MAGEKQLSGPDLTNGVPVASVESGKTLVGHANGEPVLLARQGEQIFAVSATCSHYSGPLGEGLLVDGTIRCPWHHACFDLRTGVPLRAPALNPVACYEVDVRGGNIRVGRKKPATPVPASPAAAPA